MKEIDQFTDMLKKLTDVDTLFISKSIIDDNEYKKVKLHNSEYYLYINKNCSYNTIYCVKRVFESFLKEHIKRTENEEYITYLTVLIKELLDTSESYKNENCLNIEEFEFLDELMDYAIIKNDKVIYNRNIDKHTLDTSLLKLKMQKEFNMLVKNGEVFAVKTGYYKAVLLSGSLIEDIFKIALKVRLAFLNKLYENELYLNELKSINSQLEETVKSRTAEVENKNKLLEEEKRKLNDLNLKLMELNKHLDDLSRIDPLTRLSNRRDLQEKFEQRIKKSKRKQTSLSMLIGDVDFFKVINDTYGHECGDQVLVKVANIFCDNLRSEDVISRYGGEEFVILLTEVDFFYSLSIAERLRSIIENEIFEFNGNTFNITISFGLFHFKPEISFAECIAQADEALYKAKTEGRNKVVSILEYT